MEFRRVVTALVVVLVFAGLAAAQTNNLSCQAVAVPTQIRTEGVTELIGDIVLSCSGGTPLTATTTITQTANITVFTTSPITSRSVGSIGAVDALLLIDEPASQNVCGTPNTGCSTTVTVAGTPPTQTVAPNTFPGILSNAQAVTFFNVPVVPPATAGGVRIYRITNVRVDGTKAGGSAVTPGQVIASVSIVGAMTVPNPNQIVAFAQPGLAGTISATGSTTSSFSVLSAQQCSSTNDSSTAGTTRSPFAWLNFTENFGTAFKYRSLGPAAGFTTSLAAAAVQPTTQSVPGGLNNNNTESGLVVAGVQGAVAGFADSGTRLKATFNNVPAGVRLYVPSVNRLTGTNAYNTVPTNTLGNAAYAVYVPSETFQMFAGYTPAVSGDFLESNLPAVEIPVTNGSATAVWEVVNSTTSIDTFTFPVAVRYTANPTTNSPATGLAPSTVTLTYAPSSSVTSTWIPRFSSSGTAQNIFQVIACRTILMYPYVTNKVGFDTGLAIANTSTDPFATLAQAGTCTLNFYGDTPPNQPYTTPAAVASGSVYTTMLSTVAPNFQGYIIAVCNFQFAHGFAFISDKNAINLAMGYLAGVIADPGTSTRSATTSVTTTKSETFGF